MTTLSVSKSGYNTSSVTINCGESYSVCLSTGSKTGVTGVSVPSEITLCTCGSTASVSVSALPSGATVTGWTVTNVDGVDSVLSQGKITVSNTAQGTSGDLITITGSKVGLAKVSVIARDDNGTSTTGEFTVLITTAESETNTKIGSRGWFNQYRLPMFNETDLTKCPTKEEIVAAAQRGNLGTNAVLTISGDCANNQCVKEVVVTVTPPQRYSFAGLEIAPGPLYYNGSSYEVKDSWNYDSYNSVYGKAAGSYYFSFIEMGQLFEKAGFSASDGNIENLLDPLDGWRLPTQAEWEAITMNTSVRDGSTVNGSAGKHYAMIQLTGVTHASSSTPNGLLLFPDGKTITGKTLSGMDNFTQTTGVTLSELNAYLAQGCVFLPGSGTYEPDDIHTYLPPWQKGGYDGFYRCSTEESSNNGYELYFTDAYSFTDLTRDKTITYSSIRLVRE